MYGNHYGGYQPYYPMQGGVPDQLSQLRMQQVPQVAPNQGNSGLVWVQGEAGAKSFLVAPGTTVMLMDSESPVFYLKSADQSGMPMPLRIFDFTERSASQHNEVKPHPDFDPSIYITRKEFDERMSILTKKAEVIDA